MDNTIILTIVGTIYGLVAAGLLGTLMYAEVLDGRDEQEHQSKARKAMTIATAGR